MKGDKPQDGVTWLERRGVKNEVMVRIIRKLDHKKVREAARSRQACTWQFLIGDVSSENGTKGVEIPNFSTVLWFKKTREAARSHQVFMRQYLVCDADSE